MANGRARGEYYKSARDYEALLTYCKLTISDFRKSFCVSFCDAMNSKYSIIS